MASSNFASEIKSWLTVVFKNENFQDISVNVLGNSEKGDGYLGDVVFVQASGVRTNGTVSEYSLVLKCSKRSEALKEDARFRDCFVNEIFFYDELLPTLTQFQKDKGVEHVFDKVPKCYGTLIQGDMLVIVLENLKTNGYELWPRKEPLTKSHIELVLAAYAQLHATSAALQNQEPEKFQQIATTLKNNMKSFFDPGNDMTFVFKSCMEYAAEVLKNDLDEKILLKWKNFEPRVKPLFESVRNYEGFKVLLHGDCWNNNFMYKYDSDSKKPLDVVIIDWQVMSCASPVTDLSYFLFVCISKEDIEDIDEILSFYHKTFSACLKQLGISDPDNVYSFDQLMKDWNSYCIRGIILATMLIKVCLAEKDDVVDVAEMAERGEKLGQNFVGKIKDTDNYKRRIKHIIEYADNKGLL